MDYQEFFAHHAVFGYDELLSKAKGVNRRTFEKTLEYYTKKGRLLRLRKGLYASVPVGRDARTLPVDPLLVAGKVTNDSVLAYHTALAFHGRAYSTHARYLFVSERAVKPFRFRSFRFARVPFPRSLRTPKERSTGVVGGERLGVDIRVTTLERTLVDVLDRPELSGGWEEVWRSLGSVQFFDLERTLEYALLLRSRTVAAKVGFYLSTNAKRLMVEESHLARLRSRRPRTPQYLERSNRKGGKFVKEWNLIVPKRVLERSWEEPS